MTIQRICTTCAIVASLSGMAAPTHAAEVQPFPGSKTSLAPLPVEIHTQPGQKPTIVFGTPCGQIQKLTNGFPPIVAFENFMLQMVELVNKTEILPVRLEPVCI